MVHHMLGYNQLPMGCTKAGRLEYEGYDHSCVYMYAALEPVYLAYSRFSS
jgi:hypothetical protein